MTGSQNLHGLFHPKMNMNIQTSKICASCEELKTGRTYDGRFIKHVKGCPSGNT